MTDNQYQNLVLDLRMMSKRIGAIEEKCGCKVKWKAEIEDRLARLEERVEPLECVHYDDMMKRLANMETCQKDVRSSLNRAGIAYVHEYEKESSSVSECKHDQIFVADGVCKACGKDVEPKPTTTPESSYERVVDEYDSCHATPKPSVEKCETITISRKDVETWLKEGIGDSVADHRFMRILRLALSNINGKGE